MKHNNLGGKSLFHLTVCCPSSRQARAGTQAEKEPGAGTDAEAMKEFCLMALSLIVCSSFFRALRTISHRVALSTVS